MTAVIFTILPVFGVVLAGWAVARAKLITAEGVTGFTNVTFYLFVPALLFRAMRSVDFATLDLGPLYAYYGAALLCFFAVILVSKRWLARGLRHATVTGLAMTFGNTVLLGIPLVKLAFGDAGLVILLMIISMHALILIAVATLILEFIVGAEDRAGKSHLRNTTDVLRNTVFNPVILPIVAGLLWGAFHVPLPDAIDAPLVLLGAAAGPCSLVLLGASLAQHGIRGYWRSALVLTALKNVIFPVVLWSTGRYVFGLNGLALAVVTLTAALPVGANVYLFAQRYNVAQGEITAAVTISTAASVLTLTLAMLWLS